MWPPNEWTIQCRLNNCSCFGSVLIRNLGKRKIQSFFQYCTHAVDLFLSIWVTRSTDEGNSITNNSCIFYKSAFWLVLIRFSSHPNQDQEEVLRKPNIGSWPRPTQFPPLSVTTMGFCKRCHACISWFSWSSKNKRKTYTFSRYKTKLHVFGALLQLLRIFGMTLIIIY